MKVALTVAPIVRRFPLRAAAAAVAVALLAAPALSQQSPAPPVRDKITVMMPVVDPGAEPMYAQDMGFFAKEGLDVTVIQGTNGAATTAAVASGTVDIGVSNIVSLSAAHLRGVPITLIAAGSINIDSAPNNVLVVAKNSPLKKAADLNGKTIAVSPLRSGGDLLTSLWMDKNGGDSTTVKFTEVPIPELATFIAQGHADAGFSIEPFITIGRNDVRIMSNPYTVLGDNFLITAFFASAPWAQAHPDLIARFAKAIYEAGDWANKNQSKSAEILSKYTKLDLGLVKQTVRARYATTPIRPPQIQSTIDAAAHYKYIDADFPATDVMYQPPK